MKTGLSIVFIFFVSLIGAHAQTMPKLEQVKDSLANISVLDSVKGKMEDIQKRTLNSFSRAKHRSDSSKKYLQTTLSIVPLKSDSAGSYIDTLASKVSGVDDQIADSLHRMIGKDTSQIHTLAKKIDTLENIHLPTEKYASQLDSLKAAASLSKMKREIESRQNDAQSLSNRTSTIVTEKLAVLSKEGKGQTNLPSHIDIPDADLKLPDADIVRGNRLADLKLNEDLPQPNETSLTSDNQAILGKIDLNAPIPQSLDKSKNDINKFNSRDAQGATASVSDKLNTTDKPDFTKVKEDKIEEVASIKEEALLIISRNSELLELQKQDKIVNDYKTKIKSYRNPEEYKRRTLERSQKLVTEHLAMYQNEIQQAVDKVSKYQRDMGTVLNVTKDLPEKRNPLRKLKYYERIVPGVTFQVQKPGTWLVDINPSVRYRITMYWSAGLGWNERVAFGHYDRTRNESRIYGIRSFTEVVIFKGISARLEAEDMNAFISPIQLSQDAGKRFWVWNYAAGLRKDFSFIPKVVGNAQFMYSLYTTSKHALYPTRFNVRLGFEPVVKSKRKKSNIRK